MAAMIGRGAIAFGVAASCFTTGLPGLQRPDEVPDAARERLAHHIGVWQVRTDYVDSVGNVIRTAMGSDTAKYVIGESVVELTTSVPQLGFISKAWMFYNVPRKQFYVTSVDARGDHWVLTGGLDDYVITSEPKVQVDGRTIVIRFTHRNIEEDSFEAIMEFSYDGGASWRTGYLQYLRRLAGPPAR